MPKYIKDTEGKKENFASFAQFYPMYLNQHANRICRRLHFIGSTFALLSFIALLFTGNGWWLLSGVLSGYGFAWIGHFFIEKNRPATFRYPLYSFIGDWVMYGQMLTGKVTF
ncbi:DUF962 domain-containing protein [Glaciimonas sp. Gout2]|uniref:DUF962 domain-containing protein n=1 Tax=unclassified Glaciimonas TaxID=2644401 RepID=UPI002B233DEA|nr:MULTISPECIES: DUF962 domain-containing protein [unclassified Glaciimonas]MEB0013290.1 DUF962 domain-containing protein [Glaciimonas sp. Cout2]MEB0082469.1 DUF962 domain-containing protein [Glaciimonas sp. Gout2]